MLKTYKTDNHSNRIILYTKNIHNLLIVSILPPPPSLQYRVYWQAYNTQSQADKCFFSSVFNFISDCFWSVFMNQRIFYAVQTIEK